MAPFDAVKIDSTEVPASTSSPLSDVPDYMHEVYDWAYLNPRNVRLLDREIVVTLILWGNSRRLKQALLAEIDLGATVLQAAHVYGTVIPEIVSKLNHPGQLEVVEVAPVQVERCRDKLRGFPEAKVCLGDVATLRSTPRDVVSSFFLLHEVPSDYKRAMVNTLLAHVSEGGKAVFVDYHQPHMLHPLKPLMMAIFDRFEPFAKELCDHDISEYADNAEAFTWRTETYFGGLYQKTVAERR